MKGFRWAGFRALLLGGPIGLRNCHDGAVTDIDRSLQAPDASTDGENAVEEGFSKSILVSAVRCLLTYVVFPFVTPIISFAADVGPWVGVTLGTFAIFANVFSIRRFWKAQHKWRKPVTVVHVGIIILLVILVVLDFGELFG